MPEKGSSIRGKDLASTVGQGLDEAVSRSQRLAEDIAAMCAARDEAEESVLRLAELAEHHVHIPELTEHLENVEVGLAALKVILNGRRRVPPAAPSESLAFPEMPPLHEP